MSNVFCGMHRCETHTHVKGTVDPPAATPLSILVRLIFCFKKNDFDLVVASWRGLSCWRTTFSSDHFCIVRTSCSFFFLSVVPPHDQSIACISCFIHFHLQSYCHYNSLLLCMVSCFVLITNPVSAFERGSAYVHPSPPGSSRYHSHVCRVVIFFP